MRRRDRRRAARRERGLHLRRTSRIKKAIVGLTVAFGLLMLATSGASATDQRVTRAKSLAERQGGQHAKLMAMKTLGDLDSTDSRQALKDLANDADDKTAICAISSLCREDFSGAEARIKQVFEDDDRSDAVRCAALGAYLHLRKGDGNSWRQVSGYVATHVGTNAALDAMADALAAKLWGEE